MWKAHNTFANVYIWTLWINYRCSVNLLEPITLVPYVPLALRALVLHVLRNLRVLVSYMLSCLACFVPYLLPCLTCLVFYVLTWFVRSAISCLTCFMFSSLFFFFLFSSTSRVFCRAFSRAARASCFCYLNYLSFLQPGLRLIILICHFLKSSFFAITMVFYLSYINLQDLLTSLP